MNSTPFWGPDFLALQQEDPEIADVILGELDRQRAQALGLGGDVLLQLRAQLRPGQALDSLSCVAQPEAAPSKGPYLSGADIYDVAFRRAGMLRVHRIDSLFERHDVLLTPSTMGT